MAITYIGAQVGSDPGATTANAEVGFALSQGNGETVPVAGDLVIVTTTIGTAGRTPNPAITTPAGYTSLTTLVADDTYDTRLCVSYKFMGSTPDTGVTIPASGNNADGISWAFQVLRGVDPTTPLDVTPTSATGINSGQPDPPSITPVTSGAWITTHNGLAAAATTALSSGTPAVSRGRGSGQTDTNDSRVFVTADEWTSGAFNPGVLAGGSSTADDSWASYSIAWRPAGSAVHTTSDASPATYTMSGVASKDHIGSRGSPATFAMTAVAAASVHGTTRPALSTLSDTFAGPSLDTGKWTAFTGDGSSAVSIVTHAAQFDHNGDIAISGNPIPKTGIKSGEYAVTGSYANTRFIRAATDANDWGMTTQAVLLLNENNEDGFGFLIEGADGSKELKFVIYNGFLTNWQATAPAAAITYSPTDHAWLRLEHDSTNGNFLWKTAPDSSGSPGTWTTRATQSVASLSGDPNYWDTAAFLSAARLYIAEWHWDNQFADTMWTSHARVLAVNASALANTNTDSVANPATYSTTGVATNAGLASRALPGTYSTTAAPATSTVARNSVALPATYLYSPTAATVVQGFSYTSIALPAAYTLNPTAAEATIRRNYSSVASPATYTMSGVAASDLATYTSIALPATYSYTGGSITATKGPISVALPASYSTTGFAAEAVIVRSMTSVALPATYSMSGGSSTRAVVALTSVATPASYNMTLFQATSSGSAEPTPVDNTTDTSGIHLPPTVTNDQFLDWLKDPTAKRVILFETRCLDDYGNVELLYFSSRGYVSHPYDVASNQAYLPLIRGGLDFDHRINLDLTGDRSYGDIELDNTEGDLDYLFSRMFQYQPAEAFIGDVRWPRRDFRRIYTGTVQDIGSSARDALNVKLRDRLHQLDMAITDAKIGGTTVESEKLYPLALGECHNISPVLVDASKLRFQFSILAGVDAFEVRDGGVPIKRSLINQGVEAIFELLANPASRITCSVFGDYVMPRPFDPNFDWGGYQNNVTDLIIRLMFMHGTDYNRRFKTDDIDWENFKAFRSANQQPVGMYITERMTVLDACQELAASVGARLTADINGKVQLIKIQLPAPGNVTYVTQSDMAEGSLEIAQRIPRRSSVKIGYCRNWTVQNDILAGVPEEHRKMYESEWLVERVTDPNTRLTFGLESEPEQENTLLLRGYDATIEAQRRMLLRREQRHVFRFEGFSDLVFTPVGAPMHITHPRFGLEGGKLGQVVSVQVNWLTARVVIEVLI